MRNKNTIIFLVVVFTLICGYNLYHTYNAFSKDSKVKNATEQEYDEYTADKDFMQSYQNSLKNAFSLGLDLQGGMFVTLEIGVEDVVRSLAGNPLDDAQFQDAVGNAIKAKQTSQDAFVDLFYEEFQKINPQVKLAAYYANPDNDINFQTPNEEVVEYLRTQANDAIGQTFNIIRTRIDQFGVSSPNLQLQEGSGRILVELPGVKDAERVRGLLRNTARLEFWETYDFNTGMNYFMQVNDKVRRIKAAEKMANGGDELADDEGDELLDDVIDASNDDPVEDALDDAADEIADADPLDALLGDATTEGDSGDSALENEEFSIDSSLTEDEQREQLIEQYPLFEWFFNPQQENINPSAPLLGYCSAKDTHNINKWLRHPEVRETMPNDIRFMWSAKSPIEDTDLLELVAIKYTTDGQPPLDGDVIEDASQDFDPNDNSPMVNMRMNVEGARIWSDLTADNVGKSIAIVLDNLVYSYPNVQNQISGGSSQITGNFTIEEAEDLATLLKAGKLPVQAKIQGEEIVGPTLGEKNIRDGLMSFLIAFIATVIFMFFYYSGSGLVANIALVANLFFILGVSAALNVVFTLPGIAAVVLTMGMAVDANVLIFERIREEQALGKSLKASVAAGFSNAFSSVMDANITTFLTGVVLFAFGIGPIRGFAVSLMIGIVTSLISALFITRLILDRYAEKGGESIKFGSKLTLNAFKTIDMKMTVRKKIFYGVSGVLILLSVGSFLANGFKTGVDFKGGRQYTVSFDQDLESSDVESMRTALTTAFDNNAPVIKTIGGENSLLVTTSYKVDDQDMSQQVKELLKSTLNGLNPSYNASVDSERLVGPTVAADIQRSAISSVIFSLVIIFLYIFIRFRKWQYSLGALAALLHDVTITLGIFSALGALDILPFSVEIDQAFIAAILTIVGYSINDTVVVFDRIRENLGEMKTSDISTVYNTSINQTISRTLVTSLTTLVTILILFFLGGDTIRGFMFALLIGIIVGTYSSIFVASPVAHDLLKSGEQKDAQ